MPADSVSVTGWGRTAPTTARLVRPRTYGEAAAAVRECGTRGGIARGLGRAYGDAEQNAGGAVFDMTGLDRIHAIDAGGGTVLCDAGVSLHRLMEVLNNLLDNAIRFSPRGGTIEVRLSQPDAVSACLEVRDHGLGVKPEHRPHLFDRDRWGEASILVYEAGESQLIAAMEAIEKTFAGIKVFSLPSMGEDGSRRHVELGVRGEPSKVAPAMEALRRLVADAGFPYK